jgi:hypothetical protein
MGTHFIPTREAELNPWLGNFCGKIAAGPATYDLTVSDGMTLTHAYDAWHAAYTAAIDPGTRTRPTVNEKNRQRRAIIALVRGYASTIRVNPNVSNELKLNLGLHVRAAAATAISTPATYPMLSVTELRRGTQDLRIIDSSAPTRRAKPAGTVGLLIFRHIGDGPARTPQQAQFLAFATRTEFTAEFAHADNGKTATYFARWTNFRGEMGPWSTAVSMPIAA